MCDLSLSLLDQIAKQAYVKKTFQFVILPAGSLLLSWLTVYLEEDFLWLGTTLCLKPHPLSSREKKKNDKECQVHTEC